MSADRAREPVRSCAGCRTRRRVSRLVRITSRDGRPTIGGPSDGRGAWLCRSGPDGSTVDADCLDAAARRGGFARVWRREVPPDEIEAIRQSLRPAAGGTNGAHSDAH